MKKVIGIIGISLMLLSAGAIGVAAQALRCSAHAGREAQWQDRCSECRRVVQNQEQRRREQQLREAQQRQRQAQEEQRRADEQRRQDEQRRADDERRRQDEERRRQEQQQGGMIIWW